MITSCPNCSRLYDTTEERANEPTWTNRFARWCKECWAEQIDALLCPECKSGPGEEHSIHCSLEHGP